MADLNNGKFQGLDENAKNNYADSFVGATKVAEKVKKGGSEKTSDGYVVDAIDIDWGGLKLTTISDKWSFGLQTVESTEQNAGKGDNTQGIHSTAYLLNKISNSFTQIYNEIGGTDDAADSLRKRIKEVETSIKQITDSTPGELDAIRASIKAINDELADPGATGTMLSILDALDGFDKTKGGVKDYIDKQDGALLGKSGDLWPTQHTVYGVAKYADTTVKNSLIGENTDETTADTIWGAKNYADEMRTASYTAVYDLEERLIGASTDATTAYTIWGVKNYADEIRTASYTKAEAAAGNVLGKDGDLWPTKHTV